MLRSTQVRPSTIVFRLSGLLLSALLVAEPCCVRADSPQGVASDTKSAAGLERLKHRSAAREWDSAHARWREHRRQSLPDANPTATEGRSTTGFEKPVSETPEVLAQAPPTSPPPAAQPYEQASAGRTLSIQGIDPVPSYNPDPEQQANANRLFPSEQTLGHDAQGRPQPFPVREFPESVFAWEASNLIYNPLYFEDPQLERYGHTHHSLIQPFVSSGRFGLQLVGLPYQMALDPIDRCVYALGYYRPGECAPRKYYQIPLNEDALGTEALFLTGLIAIFP